MLAVTERPSFSIVTPTLNRLSMLKEAVESVRRQAYTPVEHIIVDGGSTDGTREWVKEQSDLTFVPPPDKGVYDAMNKGIAAARGDVVGLLNSDDFYEPGTFAAVADCFAQNPHASAVAGRSRLLGGDATIATYDQPRHLVPDARDVLVGHCLPNPRFFRRRVLQEIGPINQAFGLVADRDLLLRLNEAGAKTVALDVPVYVYRRHDGSLTFDADLKLSLRLRRELLALGRQWHSDFQASAAARAAGRELQGRQHLGLALAKLRTGHFQEAASHVARMDGRASTEPTRAILYAAYMALRHLGSHR
jgi:glycosyltransferase involved in cell wall biosynthesis